MSSGSGVGAGVGYVGYGVGYVGYGVGGGAGYGVGGLVLDGDGQGWVVEQMGTVLVILMSVPAQQ